MPRTWNSATALMLKPCVLPAELIADIPFWPARADAPTIVCVELAVVDIAVAA